MTLRRDHWMQSGCGNYHALLWLSNWQLMVDLLPMWMWTAPNSMWKPPSAIWATCFRLVVVAITLLLLTVVRPGTSSESCCQSLLQSTSLSRYAARCSQLVFGQLCSMAVRPGPQTPPIYNGFAEMIVPWSGGSAVQSWKMRFPRLCFTRNWM